MKEDEIDKMFERLEGKFNIYETPIGHEKRFLEKLDARQNSKTKSLDRWKFIAIAASVAILIALGLPFYSNNTPESGLASISPEMAQTQSFFTTTINKELKTLKDFNSPEVEPLVNDAIKQISILETQYEDLKKDLKTSGHDKRVVYAMINNFQKRIDLLKEVIEKIETVKQLKATNYEATI